LIPSEVKRDVSPSAANIQGLPMRLALVIHSAYPENTVVPSREAFHDTASLFAEAVGSGDAGFEVKTLDASRDLPETLEELLREHPGKIESLLVHFTGYVAVKADRGPALLLDGARLRAFPLSRLRAAIEEGAQQTFVIIDAIPVVDAEQLPPEVAKTVSEALTSPDGSVSTLVGVEEEWSVTRRGALRLTDLFTLALAHVSQKARGGLVTSSAVYQTMQGDVLSFSNIAGLEHRAGYFDFVLLEGPRVGGFPDSPFGHERTTQPVAVFPPPVPTFPSALPTITAAEPAPGAADETPLESLPSFERTEPNWAPGAAINERAPAPEEPVAAPTAAPEQTRESQPNLGFEDRPLRRGPEGRSPTLAETPQARAMVQREWVSEAAYFPSAPPPRVAPVVATPMLYPQGSLAGFQELAASAAAPLAEETALDDSAADEDSRPTPLPRASAPRASVPSSPGPELAPEAVSSVEARSAEVSHYEALLDGLHGTDPIRAEVHARLGDALRASHRLAEALFAYERALDIDPHQEQAFDGACSLYRQQRDYAGLVSTIRRKLDATTDESARLSLLDLIVHVWQNEARDLRRTIDAIEERLAITPDDVDSFQRLIDAQEQLGDLFGRLESRERLARLDNADAKLRSALYVEAAKIAHDELDDLARTFLHLEAAIELRVNVQEALRTAEVLLGGRDRWLEVLELYERALELESDSPLAVVIGNRLVQLVLEHSAQDALKPDTISNLIRLAAYDPTLSEATARLVGTQTQGPETLDLAQSLRATGPRNAELLHHLFQLARPSHPDIAANVASVLFAEGAASLDEAEFAKALHTDSLPVPQRALENADYEALIYPADFDREMAISLDQLDQTLILADAFAAKTSVTIPKDATVLDPETSTVTLARSFLWTSRFLAVAIPELAVASDTPTVLRLVLREERPCMIVSKALGSGFNLPELAYLAARHATLLLPGFAIRDHSADPRMLGSALYVLSAVVNGSSRELKALGEYEQKLGKRLSAQLEKNALLMAEAVRVVGRGTASLAECESRAYHFLRAVDHVRLRVALLACGNPAIALKLNRDFPLDGPYTAEEQLDLLAAYAGSPEHCELRSRLGIARAYADQS
jgi:tetratricopeptide (TPR) repeat protein